MLSCQSAATLNLLRSFATGGYAAMQRVTQWNLDFPEHSEQGDRYQELAHRVDEALGFMSAAELTVDHPIMRTTEFWTSHECLHLPYEQSLTMEDSTSGLFYDCSAHMLSCGERTRQLDGAHVEFLRGISNPIEVKEKIHTVQKQVVDESAKPNTKTHTLFSTECTPYFDWQTVGIFCCGQGFDRTLLTLHKCVCERFWSRVLEDIKDLL